MRDNDIDLWLNFPGCMGSVEMKPCITLGDRPWDTKSGENTTRRPVLLDRSEDNGKHELVEHDKEQGI